MRVLILDLLSTEVLSLHIRDGNQKIHLINLKVNVQAYVEESL